MDIVAKFFGLLAYTDGSQSTFGVHLNENGDIICLAEKESKQTIANLYADPKTGFTDFLIMIGLTVTPPTKIDPRIINSYDFNLSGLIDQDGTITPWAFRYMPDINTIVISAKALETLPKIIADTPTKIKLQNMLQKVLDGTVTFN